jgi:hypothetical protein
MRVPAASSLTVENLGYSSSDLRNSEILNTAHFDARGTGDNEDKWYKYMFIQMLIVVASYLTNTRQLTRIVSQDL